VRTAVQALAAVLGGTQSLHTNSLDEAYALPSEEAVTIALRTQQILAHESNVAAVADPLGGSFFVETLTAKMEAAALDYIRRIDEMGGMIPAIERGFPQSEIADASYQFQCAVETGEQKIVGVNAFTESATEPIALLQIDERAQKLQCEKLAALRARRDHAAVARCLEQLREAARAGDGSTYNTMPLILEAVKAYATVGEICEAFRDVFGSYTETSIL
jgi:methylmalonyl-CoA mutase, N-terminal domain